MHRIRFPLWLWLNPDRARGAFFAALPQTSCSLFKGPTSTRKEKREGRGRGKVKEQGREIEGGILTTHKFWRGAPYGLWPLPKPGQV